MGLRIGRTKGAPRARRGIGRLKAASDGIDLYPRLFDRSAVAQTAERIAFESPAWGPAASRGPAHTASAKLFRQDADDRRRRAVDVHGHADDVRALAKLPFPKCVADKRRRRGARDFISGHEVAPDCRLYANQAECVDAPSREGHVDGTAVAVAKRDGLAGAP